jgi:hypothetical protein
MVNSSVHNVRIERLWVDVRIGITATWDTNFTELEMRHGLDINNPHHLWLLHLLFLPVINLQLQFWAESWNLHKISSNTDHPSRSPDDMFGFDMLVCGLRGDFLNDLVLGDEELEVFGVDWEGLHEDTLLRSMRENYAHDGASSWIGRRGPPPTLNEVRVEPPPVPDTIEGLSAILDQNLSNYARSPEIQDVVPLWIQALALARQHSPELF